MNYTKSNQFIVINKKQFLKIRKIIGKIFEIKFFIF
jgi:hypothetical protein